MSKCVKCGNEILTGDIHWEMGLCNNCYNELYKDHKTHISLDKMWLKLAQDFRDENEKLQDKVADLEAKLADIQNEKDELTHWKGECVKNVQYILELKQQLAEKDTDLSLARNEINTLKHNLNVSQEHDNIMCEQYFNKCKETNQDKISFAVEKLEEVKEICKEIPQCDEYGDDWVLQSSLFECIDNKIKAIKNQKE